MTLLRVKAADEAQYKMMVRVLTKRSCKTMQEVGKVISDVMKE